MKKIYDKDGNAFWWNGEYNPDGSPQVQPETQLDINLSPFGIDTGIPLPDPIAAALVSAGSTFNKAGYAMGDMLGLIDDQDKAQLNQEQSLLAGLERDYPISTTVGGALPFLPTAVFGGLPAAAAIGGAEGFLDYSPDSSALWRTAKGAGFGLAGDFVGGLATRMINGVRLAASRTDAPISEAAQYMKGRGVDTTPGQKYDSDQLKQFEAGASKNMLMGNYFSKTGAAQRELAAGDMVEAIGLDKSILDMTGGKITPEIIDKAEARLDDYFSNFTKGIGRLDLNPGLVDVIKQDPQFKKAQRLGFFSTIGDDAPYIVGNEYQQLRQILAQSAAKEANNGQGQIAELMYNKIEQLDNSIARFVPDEFLDDYARAREQYRVLQILQTGGKLNADGDLSIRSMNTAINREFGKKASRGQTNKMQPETAQLFDMLRNLNSGDILPIAGDSGTTGGLMADNLISDIGDAVFRGNEKGGIENILSRLMFGKLYETIGRKAPNLIGGMLDDPGKEAELLKRLGARVAAAEANEDE